MVEFGSLKGTVLKIMMDNEHEMDLQRIYSSVEKEVKHTSKDSIRGTLVKLANEGYLYRPRKGIYKVTKACLKGMLDAGISEQTVKFACGLI